MTETLTGEQTPATREAMAGATPDTAPAAPGARAAIPAADDTAPPRPRKGDHGRPGTAGEGVSTAGATGHPGPATPATDEGERTLGQRATDGLLVAVTFLGLPLVGTIGFAASYSTLKAFALAIGFSSTIAFWFPIAIDASILVFLAADLIKIRKGSPMPLLRYSAHLMTLVTVVLNAAGGDPSNMWQTLASSPLSALSHGVMPFLFIVGVEAGRHTLMAAARIRNSDTHIDSIPRHRWLLSPVATARLYRRMRLANVRSYEKMVDREQALEGYQVWLSQKYGGKPNKATDKERLPMTMAHRGYTVEEALALPAKWETEAAERQRAEAERERQEKRRQAEQAKADRIDALEDDADVEEAQHRITARTGTAAAEAEAANALAEQRRRQVERQTRAEEEAEESEAAAAARRKTAEDVLRAEEAEEAAAKTRERAAHTAWEAEHKAAEAERLKRQRETDRKQAVLDGQAVSDAERATAAARLETANLEARAQQVEDYARLSSRERNERRVARMLKAACGDQPPHKDAVPLTAIEGELSVGRTVASELRTAALELLHNGYQPDTFLDGAPRA